MSPRTMSPRTTSPRASPPAFTPTEVSVPAGTAFAIEFDNQDSGIPHNIVIHRDTATGEVVFQGDIINGPSQKTYSIPALTAGTYAFVCIVHPNMVGTLTVTQ